MKIQNNQIELYPWHNDNWAKFKKFRENRRLPHAILLSGPSGLGKKTFAFRMSLALICETDIINQQPCLKCNSCRLALNHSHPDIFWLEPDGENKNIKVESVRNMIDRTSLKAQDSGKRVFIINLIDFLNKSGLNALLKTLEEPTPSCIFILISSSPHILPSTVISRCQKLSFQLVKDSMASSWLTQYVSNSDVKSLISLSGGLPLKAIELYENGGLKSSKSTISIFSGLKARKINPIEAIKTLKELEQKYLFDDIAKIICDFIKLKNTNNPAKLFFNDSKVELFSICNDLNIEKLFQFLDTIFQIKKQMHYNLNFEMTLEKIIIDWLEITRPISKPG